MTSEISVTGYRGELPPEQFNMAAYAIGRAAAATPDKPALVVIDAADAPPTEIWTYTDLEAAVLGIATALKACLL